MLKIKAHSLKRHNSKISSSKISLFFLCFFIVRKQKQIDFFGAFHNFFDATNLQFFFNEKKKPKRKSI